MAYISPEEVKVIRNNLKKEFPNLKFSVRGENYSSVRVVLKSGDVDFGNVDKSVNQYCINENYKDNEVARKTLSKIKEIICKEWWDESDIQTDYFNTAFYYTIRIGEWDSPYILKEKISDERKELNELHKWKASLKIA